METLARADNAIPDTEPELQLLLEPDYAGDWRRWKRAAVGSVVVHVTAVLVALAITDSPEKFRNVPAPRVVHITPLYIPTEFTQKAPNRGKISKEIRAQASGAKLASPVPAPRPTPLTVPKIVFPLPVQQLDVARATPKPIVIEPPKIEAETPQSPQVAKLLAPPAPQAKLELQNVVAPPAPSPGEGKPAAIALPSPSVQEAIRAVTRGGSGAQSLGDLGIDDHSIELKSDPMGVDFRPYLQQVLVAVKRNWLAVYPEAARLGQRGQVSLQFAIVKQGTVTKVIFSTESGAKALDQAAVAAISASNPLPPLPVEFRGDRIVLQMTFQYNMPR